MREQIAAFLCCASSSGWMWRQWWRLDEYDRAHVWKHYGLFCMLTCFGCFMGAVSSFAIMQCFISFYQSVHEESVFGNSIQENLSYASVSSFIQLRLSAFAFACLTTRIQPFCCAGFSMGHRVCLNLSFFVLLPRHCKTSCARSLGRFLQA